NNLCHPSFDSNVKCKSNNITASSSRQYHGGILTFGSTRTAISGLGRLSECNDEVKHHLISCHLSKEVLSENELILARIGLFHLAQEDKQRKCGFAIGIATLWGSFGEYPDHDGVRKRIQGRDVISLHMSQDIQKLFEVIIPVESALCVPCRRRHKKKVDDSESRLTQEESEKNLRSPETPLLNTRQLR
ncbi:unnamed protein product, partial [Pocillopora meandrina]